MPRKHIKSPTQNSSPAPSPSSDKKIHTAGLGFVLLILTNYQSEVKQILQLIMTWIT